VEPGFMNAAEHGFALKPGSPCLGAGIDVVIPFHGEAPDLGAGTF